MLSDIQLPEEYAKGLEGLLLKEQQDDQMGVDTEIQQKQVKIAELQAEAEAVQKVKGAEGEAQSKVVEAKGEADAMQYTLPLKQKQIEQSKLEAEARKEATIQNFRHPAGGRKDIFHWVPRAKSRRPSLKMYCPGEEFVASEPPAADLAARMVQNPQQQPEGLEAAGVIDSKFGPLALLRLPGRLDPARLASASPSGLAIPLCKSPVGRAGDHAVGATGSDRLHARPADPAGPGNEPKLAELFARAELGAAVVAWPPLFRRTGSPGGQSAHARSAVTLRSCQGAGFHTAFRPAGHYSFPVWPDSPCDADPDVKIGPETRRLPEEDLMTPGIPAANRVAVLFAAVAIGAVGFAASPAGAQTANPPKKPPKEAKRQFDNRGRAYYGPSGPNVSYQDGPQRASSSPSARGSMPGPKSCRATASSPTTRSRRNSAIRHSRAKTTTVRSTGAAEPLSDMGGYPSRIPLPY